jgi:hypothetical protein
VSPDFEHMIETLVRELLPLARGEPTEWEPRAVASSIPAALDRTGTAESLLAWAGDHRRWRFAVAEASEEACAKPREAAVSVVRLILEERFDEIADQG